MIVSFEEFEYFLRFSVVVLGFMFYIYGLGLKIVFNFDN